ncbi:MFS transporter [Burkholderia anthina]|uniref:MFS transporter n=1 Tax=Burkholderia anthina TaxID=179879 RepID=UPI00158AA38A
MADRKWIGVLKVKNRWYALLIIFVSFLQFTINWFNIVPAFGGLESDLQLRMPELGLVVGMFIAGYGIAHIPGGMLAEACGMRFAMLFGIAVETFGTVLSACAHDYTLLLVGRFVCGVGGSIYIGSAIGLTTAWFRDHEIALANGLIAGVAFTIGAALGLFVWADVVKALGWRHALLFGAFIGAATLIALAFLFPEPARSGQMSAETTGHHLDRASMRRIFGNGKLWVLGLAYLGGYGSYFTAAQLLPSYAADHLHLDAQAAGSLGVTLLLSGALGGALGGWVADKWLGHVPTIVGAWVLQAVALMLVPHLGYGGLQVAAAAIGGFAVAGGVAWFSLPGLYRSELELSDIPTAVGLMLTIVATGGVAIPAAFGKVATDSGYPAAWLMLGIATAGTTLFCFFIRKPDAVPADSFECGRVAEN